MPKWIYGILLMRPGRPAPKSDEGEVVGFGWVVTVGLQHAVPGIGGQPARGFFHGALIVERSCLSMLSHAVVQIGGYANVEFSFPINYVNEPLDHGISMQDYDLFLEPGFRIDFFGNGDGLPSSALLADSGQAHGRLSAWTGGARIEQGS